MIMVEKRKEKKRNYLGQSVLEELRRLDDVLVNGNKFPNLFVIKWRNTKEKSTVSLFRCRFIDITSIKLILQYYSYSIIPSKSLIIEILEQHTVSLKRRLPRFQQTFRRFKLR
jgi:hypothetical protein